MDINIMKQGLLRLSVFFLWTSGLIHGSDVTQTDILWKNKGENATMHCSHTKAADFFQMYWYRQLPGETMKQIVYTSTTSINHDFGDFSKDKFAATKPNAESGTFTVKNLEPEDKGLYFCAVSKDRGYEAHFGGGTKLTVLEENLKITPPTVEVLHPSAKECKNKRGNAEKTIVCLASGFYPDHVSVSWQVGGEDVTTGVATDNAALRREDKYYTITSRLRVSAKDWYNPNTEFKCTVSFYNGTETTLHSDEIYGDKAKEGVLTREKYLKITQAAKLSYGVFIVKSMVYGVFVAFLVWKLQNSSGKRNH